MEIRHAVVEAGVFQIKFLYVYVCMYVQYRNQVLKKTKQKKNVQ